MDMQRSIARIKQGFESSCGTTPEFKSFALLFKKELTKAIVPHGARISQFTRGHFYVSGFIRDAQEVCHYFSISDVRFFPDCRILLRIAKDEKDYTGGTNCMMPLSHVSAPFAVKDEYINLHGEL